MNDAMVRNMDPEELVREAEARGLGDDALCGRLMGIVQAASEGAWEERYSEAACERDKLQARADALLDDLKDAHDNVLDALFERIETVLFEAIETTLRESLEGAGGCC